MSQHLHPLGDLHKGAWTQQQRQEDTSTGHGDWREGAEARDDGPGTGKGSEAWLKRQKTKGVGWRAGLGGLVELGGIRETPNQTLNPKP